MNPGESILYLLLNCVSECKLDTRALDFVVYNIQDSGTVKMVEAG